MSAIKLDQLDAQLARALAPVYVVHGDEPLLSLEAADAIRAKARAAGYTQRDVHTVERGFDWSRLSASASAMSLFGDRTLIELRLPTGKPGTEGAAAIVAHCQTVSDDVLTLVSVPRLDRAGQNSAWFGALDRAGVVVNVFGVDRARLPQWIAQRLAGQKQRAATDALAFIADCVEGNLLAAHQEIQKLGLLYPEGELAFEQIREAVLNVARFDVYQISEALLSGDAKRLARVLDGLRGEGEASNRVLWVMSEDVRAVLRVQTAQQNGQSLQDVYRAHRIWGEPRQRAIGAAARRLSTGQLEIALAQAAAVDRTIKGLAKGDAWDELLQLGMRLV
ncbi:MAG TPA: DNA polymerase III subunit delta [Burkholderiales bacterium]